MGERARLGGLAPTMEYKALEAFGLVGLMVLPPGLRKRRCQRFGGSVRWVGRLLSGELASRWRDY